MQSRHYFGSIFWQYSWHFIHFCWFLSVLVLLLLSTHVERFSVSRRLYFFVTIFFVFGKNLVFTMTNNIIPEFWRNQEIPEKFCKRYEQVKLVLFQKKFIPDFILNSRILPSQTPTNHPTILLDILCLVNLNYYFFV